MTLDHDTLTMIVTAVTIGWPATILLAYLETRRRWANRCEAKTLALNAAHRRLIVAGDETERQRTARAAAERALATERTMRRAAEIERDLRRPANPITAWITVHGPKTTYEVTQRFGAGAFTKLVELQDRGELATDGDYWYRPPARRAAEVPPWDTIRPEGWDPTMVTATVTGHTTRYPPPRHRAHLELVETGS